MRKIILISAIFFIITFSGCRMEEEIVTKQSVVQTIIVTNFPSPTVTDTFVVPLYPTSTFTPTPTLLETQAPTYTIEPYLIQATVRSIENEATLRARGVACNPGEKLELPDVLIIAANEEWTIYTCSPEPIKSENRQTPDTVDYSKRYTKVIKTDFSQTWTIFHKNFDWFWMNDRSDAMIFPYRWTRDGKFLYFIPEGYPRGSSSDLSSYFTSLGNLYRLDLRLGEIEYIQPWGRYSLSPDDRYLVYSKDEQHIVYIKDMLLGKEYLSKLDPEYEISGNFVWKPDSEHLVFAAGVKGWKDGKAGVSLFKITIRNIHLQNILYNDMHLFVPDYDTEIGGYWIGENELSLWSLADFDRNWSIDTNTGILTPLSTETPNP